MTSNKSRFPSDRTASGRRDDLTEEELKDLELAGGVEGGMPAGSAGPSSKTEADPPHNGEKKP
jgi:hypothetical protein